MDKSDSSTSARAGSGQPAPIVTPFNRHRRPGLQANPLSPADEARLARFRETIDQLPDIDATRVVRLHHQIQAGDYKVDSDRLAEKLVALETLLSRE